MALSVHVDVQRYLNKNKIVRANPTYLLLQGHLRAMNPSYIKHIHLDGPTNLLVLIVKPDIEDWFQTQAIFLLRWLFLPCLDMTYVVCQQDQQALGIRLLFVRRERLKKMLTTVVCTSKQANNLIRSHCSLMYIVCLP